MKDENKILRNALNEFKKITGLELNIVGNLLKNPDNDIELKLKIGNRTIKLFGEIKPWITRNMVGHVLNRRYNQTCIIITRHITKEVAEELKNRNIQFLDTAGNAYINNPPAFVYIRGNRIIRDVTKPRPRRLFRTAGLKILFVLINNPVLLNKTYRTIADAGDTALGTVAYVFDDLKELGYLQKIGENRKKLVRKKELINKWIENYNEVLRPKIIRGKYKTKIIEWWKTIDPKEYDIYWGGEIGAYQLTRYLKPKIETIYTNKGMNRLILKNKFIKDDMGDIEILHKFWNFEYNEDTNNIVPPLLIYADLVRIPDERNLETAKRLYEEKIFRLVE